MMDSCKNCKSLAQCDNIGIPKEVISRVIDLIKSNHDDTIIESIIVNEFNYPISSSKYSIKMLIKYLLNIEDDCIENRDKNK